MPEYLTPGLYVEEIDSGSKPIEGVGTTTAAFVGFAKSGEFNKPTFVTSWSDFVRIFGEDDAKILPVLGAELGKRPVEILSEKRLAKQTLEQYADEMFRQLDKDKLPKDRRSYFGFGRDKNLNTVPNPYMEKSYLAYAVQGFFANGGTKAYIVRVAREGEIDFLTKDGMKALPAVHATAAIGGFTVKAIDAGAKGNEIEVEVEHKGDGDEFILKVKGPDGEVTIHPPANKKALTMAGLTKNLRIGPVEVDEIPTATATATRPDAKIYQLIDGMDASMAPSSATPLKIEKDLAKVETEDFIGKEDRRSGMKGLAEVDDVNFICMPDLMWDVMERSGKDKSGPEIATWQENDGKRKKQILGYQKLLIDYCDQIARDRIAIIDCLPGLDPIEVRDMIQEESNFTCRNGQAAFYYPWLQVPDMVDRTSKKTVLVPPCGHVAGLWARTIINRGVHKAPANEGVMGAVDVERQVTKAEQGPLNEIGINCIRTFPNEGIKVWGARTLATIGNPSWKYVNVRALFNYLEKSMERNLQWTVFEPNDQDLWDRVRRTISTFLFTEWKEGKLFGAVPEQAYYVKCDRETNPQAMIDLGRLYVEVGINPVKPAEFVIIRMGQWAGGSETSES